MPEAPDQHRPPQSAADLDPALARYSRQMLFDKIGEQGQRRLGASRVVLIGCGALGTVLAETLVRAGVGSLRICDRDYIELNNLQRQVLFDEEDIAADLPKAEAAVRKLRRINSAVTVEAEIVDVDYTNIERLTERADLILDGTDNFETRFLINDLCVKTRRPWIYGAVIGATGLCMPILPHETPCLRCVWDQAPPPEMNPTCDTAGVLGPVVNMVASFQALEAIKLLAGLTDEVTRRLISIDAWSGRVTLLSVQSARDDGDCTCCKHGVFPYLTGERSAKASSLCGRNAVQVRTATPGPVDFAAIAAKLRSVARSPIRHNPYMLRVEVDTYELTLFADGRAIIKGTSDPDRARAIYAKYIGA